MLEMSNSVQHLVLADDDSDHGVLFKRILRELAPEIHFKQVYNGEELLKFLYMYKTDLLFLDLRMPCKNGHECLDEIKSNPVLNDLPIIVYSSSCQISDIQKSFSHQADVYMVKPFSGEHLKKALQMVLAIDWKGNLPIRRHYFMNNRFVPYTATA